MKKFVLLSLFGLIGLSGCTKQEIAAPLCDIAVKSVTGAAQGVADVLKCSNLPAVAATLSKPITDLKMCESTTQGLVGDLVCGQTAKFVVGMGVNAIPAEWGCTGGPLGDKAEAVITDACKKAINF